MQRYIGPALFIHLLFEGEEVFLCVDAGLRAELSELLPSFVLNLDTHMISHVREDRPRRLI